MTNTPPQPTTEQEGARCPHLNCLVYHGGNPCTCDMKPYCEICRETKPQPTVKESLTIEQEWTKEFDDQFTYLDEDGDMYLLGNYDFVNKRNTDNIHQIKSFISAQRQQAATEATRKERERIKGLVKLIKSSNELGQEMDKFKGGKINLDRVVIGKTIDIVLETIDGSKGGEI